MEKCKDIIIAQLIGNLKGFIEYVENEYGTMPSGILHKAAGIEIAKLHQWSKNCIIDAEKMIKDVENDNPKT